MGKAKFRAKIRDHQENARDPSGWESGVNRRQIAQPPGLSWEGTRGRSGKQTSVFLGGATSPNKLWPRVKRSMSPCDKEETRGVADGSLAHLSQPALVPVLKGGLRRLE